AKRRRAAAGTRLRRAVRLARRGARAAGAARGDGVPRGHDARADGAAHRAPLRPGLRLRERRARRDRPAAGADDVAARPLRGAHRARPRRPRPGARLALSGGRRHRLASRRADVRVADRRCLVVRAMQDALSAHAEGRAQRRRDRARAAFGVRAVRQGAVVVAALDPGDQTAAPLGHVSDVAARV
ncbi:MAG: 5-carboxymethyl uridine and 5-carboxymethyl 2-thiouridine methyltransferase, partial [uncultured Solirubrobacteraceae bacterium]